VLLSPFLAPGTTASTPFNHYSLLRTIEGLFGTHAHLGYAGPAGLVGLFDTGSGIGRQKPPHEHRRAASGSGSGPERSRQAARPAAFTSAATRSIARPRRATISSASAFVAISGGASAAIVRS
jgi:hypothetical protein